MQLSRSIRESLVADLDTFLENYGNSDPEAEAVVTYLVELLEGYAEEEGVDDIVFELEDSAGLEAPLREVLEEEMSSNYEFEYTGEEVVSLLERICEIEWEDLDDDDDDEAAEEDEEGDEDEDLDEL